jgi:hypothetical protein
MIANLSNFYKRFVEYCFCDTPEETKEVPIFLSRPEKIRLILSNARSNAHLYEPSFHLLSILCSVGSIDITPYLKAMKESFLPVIDIIEMSIDNNDDWNELNPGPYWYINENNIHECFMVIEEKLIDIFCEQFSKLLFNNLAYDLSEVRDAKS